MAYLCVDSLVDYLESLETEGNISFPLNDQIQGLKLELRFLSTFLRCTSLGLITDGDERLLDLLTRIDAFAEEEEMELLVIADKDLSCKVPVMLEAIKLIKSEIRRIFVKELESQTEVNNLPGYEIVLELVECVLGNLRALVDAEAKSIGPSKIQIEALQKSIGFLGSAIQFIANRCIDEYDILEDLLTHVLAVTQRAACLSYLCWVDELVDEEMVGGICVRLSDLLRKIKSTTNPEAREFLFAVLKVSKSPSPDIAMKEEFVVAFIDSLLENLMELQDSEDQARLTVPLEFEIQNTLQELRFLKALIIDLPNQYDEPQDLDNFLIRIESVVCEAGCLVYMICAIVQKEDVVKEMNFALHDFLEQIGRIKAEIRRIYLEKLHNNSPGNCDTLFIYPILSNLKDLLNNHNKSIDTAKQQIETLLRGLASLNSFFEKQGGLKEYCLRFIDAAYQADYVVNSFVSRGGPVWHHLLCTVLDEINLINADLIETYTKKNIDSAVLEHLETSTDPLGKIYLARSYLTNDAIDFNDGVVALDDEARLPSYLRNTINFNVGAGLDLNDEANRIIDRLKWGSRKLDIVSIVGMPGAGKTFLAQNIYRDPSFKSHFHYHAWCCVSQEYRPRELVLSILESITGLRSDVYKMGNEDLELAIHGNVLQENKGR
ncbi:hypothetical protein ACH5RR_030244 [Cinchona calisaya]|uniref:NB-ARC domain-containing protein n=1 Tax=Cinchona calisaya TaxID=153742 RepID=A0ABD2YZ90_9GENT